MEKLPKFGDIIEVKDYDTGDYDTGDYERRIFVGFTKNNVHCVCGRDEYAFNNGKSFSTSIWNIWREIKKPEYVPFTVKDADMFRGKWIRNKKSDLAGEELITSIKRCGIETDSTNRDYLYFLKYYTFLDGSPCGKLKEVE